MPLAPVRSEPVVDGARQHPGEWLLAVQRAGVALEEQALCGPQGRIADPLPHHADDVAQLPVGRLQESLLVLLDGFDDGGHQPLSGAEVVDQHPVAGAHSGGDVAQRAVAQALAGEVVDDGSQQVLTLHDPSVPCGTCTDWYSSVLAQGGTER